MFVLEFESAVPPSAASYYTLVIRRDPYVVGRLATCDISLPELTDVSRQHMKIEVMRASDALQLDPTYHPAAARNETASRLFGHSDSEEEEVPQSGEAPPFGGLEFCLSRIPDALVLAEEDPLVLRLTNLSKFGFRLTPPPSAAPPPSSSADVAQDGPEDATRSSSRVSCHRPGPTPLHVYDTHPVNSAAFAHSGWWIHLGESCVLRLSFRPVLVSIARDYSPGYLKELETIYRLLGATCTGSRGPVPYRRLAAAASDMRASAPGQQAPSAPFCAALRRPHPQLPILAAHVCELIADDSWCIMALATGYTIVEPTYVLEWYGCIAGACRSPLHELPPPREFAPHTKSLTYGSATYLRPEPLTCPFSLYAWPRSTITTATLHNNSSSSSGAYLPNGPLRDALFQRKLFFAPTDCTLQRNRDALTQAGGAVIETVADVLTVSRNRATNVFVMCPDGKRQPMNLALHARYVVVEDALEQSILSTSVAALKEYSKVRKERKSATRQNQPIGTDPDEHEEDEDGTGGVVNTSLFSAVAAHDLGEPESLDAEEATMRLLVKLYLLTHKFGWTIITERCIHTSLLTNVWSLESVTFQEVVVVEADGADEEGDQVTDPHSLPLVVPRHPSLEQHDAAVYRDILAMKGAHVGGLVGGSPMRPAGQASLPINSPQPRNPNSADRQRNAVGPSPRKHRRGATSPRHGQEEVGSENDSDRTPSVLSNEEGREPSNEATGRLRSAGTEQSPVQRRVPSVLEDALVRSPEHVVNSPQSMQALDEPKGRRRPKGAAPQLTSFEAQAEHIHRNIQLLLRPSEKNRLEGVLATTRRLYALEPVDAVFVQGIKGSAEVQLRALEHLHIVSQNLQGRPGGEDEVVDMLPITATRSRALLSMWNECALVVSMADEILSFSGRRRGAEDESHRRVAPLVANKQSSSFTIVPSPGKRVAGGGWGSGFGDEGGHGVGTHRKHPACDSMSLRPSTRLLRYPTASAPFLGPEIHRVQLNPEQLLTAKLLAPVGATNLPAIAEKRRLFIKRYKAEEGEKRFALWMQSNGMQWTLQLYKQLEEKKLTLLEMLQYE